MAPETPRSVYHPPAMLPDVLREQLEFLIEHYTMMPPCSDGEQCPECHRWVAVKRLLLAPFVDTVPLEAQTARDMLEYYKRLAIIGSKE